MIRTIVDAFVVPSAEERRGFVALEKTVAVHEQTIASLACMNAVRAGGKPAGNSALAFPFTAATWNLERCLFPQESAEKLRATGAPLVLLSEMDEGMARTRQGDPTAELAALLGMSYAYGVEFLELGLGSEIEHSFCEDDFNAKGFHGNALLASVPLGEPFMLRLPGTAHWFLNDPAQPRIGERCAIGARIETEAGPFLAVSVHLESAADGPYRERQTSALIDALDAFAPGLPVLIAGDLNTGNQTGGDFEAEGLFAMATARGFTRHGGPLDEMSTRPSLISRNPERAQKLDWFLSRGLIVTESHLVPSLTTEGKPLSDHDLLVCTIEGFG
ncbi:endonuclease [Rhizobium sp. BK251]|uniref:endonuclease/exonuclease/phosphatase family protein n=1 Tax=Rhizobium sp. BK251 TaxID=2512125 RepID=UPI00104EA69F|nr:endonuclease [Rhizobium sp. BK251]TCL72118.1 endonuclease/exonuclease/phosphatase family metal-dependent hydrolase [Rhizobium sp. BK251]